MMPFFFVRGFKSMKQYDHFPILNISHFDHFSIRPCSRLELNTRNAEWISTGYEELRKFANIRASHVLLPFTYSLSCSYQSKDITLSRRAMPSMTMVGSPIFDWLHPFMPGVSIPIAVSPPLLLPRKQESLVLDCFFFFWSSNVYCFYSWQLN